MQADGRDVIETGALDVIDNQIDATTGTIRMKAKFPNTRRLLWPGQFVNVRIRTDTLQGVVAVPTASVQRGPAGTFVWVVGAESAATVRPVETGLTTETLAVIVKGLEVGEQVVTTGFARIADGARLIVRDAPASTPVGFVAPPRAKRGEKGDGGGDRGKRRREREGAEGRPATEAPPANAANVIPQTSEAPRAQTGATR